MLILKNMADILLHIFLKQSVFHRFGNKYPLLRARQRLEGAAEGGARDFVFQIFLKIDPFFQNVSKKAHPYGRVRFDVLCFRAGNIFR